jgi:pyocin large subunit-like protein
MPGRRQGENSGTGKKTAEPVKKTAESGTRGKTAEHGTGNQEHGTREKKTAEPLTRNP